jgi:hypothetical protein
LFFLWEFALQNLFYRDPSVCGAGRGFSMIEVLIVLALIGILAAAATPDIVSTMESHHRSTISNRLMEDLALARLQAISIASSMAVCPSNSAIAVNYTCDSSTVWSKGWYVYAGSSNALTSASAAAGAVLGGPQPVPRGWVVDAHLSSPGTYVNVDARSSSTKYGHFTIYRSGYSTTAGCVTFSATARARTYTADVSTGVVSANNDPC